MGPLLRANPSLSGVWLPERRSHIVVETPLLDTGLRADPRSCPRGDHEHVDQLGLGPHRSARTAGGAIMSTINGSSGNNTLKGTAYADTIHGYGGNDLIY